MDIEQKYIQDYKDSGQMEQDLLKFFKNGPFLPDFEVKPGSKEAQNLLWVFSFFFQTHYYKQFIEREMLTQGGEFYTKKIETLANKYFRTMGVNPAEITPELILHWSMVNSHITKTMPGFKDIATASKDEKQRVRDLFVEFLESGIKNKPAAQIAENLIEDYHKIAQNAVTNKFMARFSERKVGFQTLFGGAGKYEEKTLRIMIEQYSQLLAGVRTSAVKLLDCLQIKATEKSLSDTLVVLPLDEYMEMRGLKDKKEARKQIKNDFTAIDSTYLEHKNGHGWLRVHISGGTSGVKNGKIVFRFNTEYFELLKLSGAKYLYMYYPQIALKLNDSYNPYSYFLCRRISEHKRMNLGKSNENIIRVETLLMNCANYPLYEDIVKDGGHLTKEFIEPFERDMDALNSVFNWQYQDGQPATYEEFWYSNVIINWHNYPDTNTLVANKTKRTRRIAQTNTKNKQQDKEIKQLKEDVAALNKSLGELFDKA